MRANLRHQRCPWSRSLAYIAAVQLWTSPLRPLKDNWATSPHTQKKYKILPSLAWKKTAAISFPITRRDIKESEEEVEKDDTLVMTLTYASPFPKFFNCSTSMWTRPTKSALWHSSYYLPVTASPLPLLRGDKSSGCRRRALRCSRKPTNWNWLLPIEIKL